MLPQHNQLMGNLSWKGGLQTHNLLEFVSNLGDQQKILHTCPKSVREKCTSDIQDSTLILYKQTPIQQQSNRFAMFNFPSNLCKANTSVKAKIFFLLAFTGHHNVNTILLMLLTAT